jgi:hypothetical protein
MANGLERTINERLDILNDKIDVLNNYFSGIERSQDAISVIDVSHKEVHEGYYYESYYYSESKNNNQYLDILYVVGSNLDFHVVVTSTEMIGKFTKQVFLNPTVSNNGTELKMYNNNLNFSENSCTMKLYHTPTVSNTGTECFAPVTTLGGSSQPTRVLSSESMSAEKILKKGTKILVRITNLSGTAAFILYRTGGYEHQV